MTLENQASPSENAAPAPARFYPPLQLWKLALLLASTVFIYSLFWFYRAAKDVRVAVAEDVKPWLWVFAPLTGLSNAIAGGRLTRMVQEWTEKENVPVQTSASPELVGILFFVAHLSVTFYDRLPQFWWLFPLGMTLLFVPFLLVQKQLNAVKLPMDASAFYSAPMRYTKTQAVVVGVFGTVMLLFGAIVMQDFASRGAAQALAIGEVLTDPQEQYQIAINVEGWKRIEPGHFSEDTEFEMVSSFSDDSVMVFSSSQTGIDEWSEFRVDWIRESFAKAECQEEREFLESTNSVAGTLNCFGKDVLYGHYHYRSRAYVRDGVLNELIIFIAAAEKAPFEKRKKLLELTEGFTLL